jgi:hypothetical protein
MHDILAAGELRSFPVAFVPTLLLCCGSCGQHLPRRWCHLAGERKDCAAELQSVAKSAAKQKQKQHLSISTREMASSMDTATFFSKGTSEQYKFVLNFYTDAVRMKAELKKSKKPEDLVKLDKW